MSTPLTRHAVARKQQRSVPQLIIDWLLDFGHYEFDKNGARRHFFTKHSLRRIERECGHQVVRRLTDFWNAYLVLSLDGAIITVGYR